MGYKSGRVVLIPEPLTEPPAPFQQGLKQQILYWLCADGGCRALDVRRCGRHSPPCLDAEAGAGAAQTRAARGDRGLCSGGRQKGATGGHEDPLSLL